MAYVATVSPRALIYVGNPAALVFALRESRNFYVGIGWKAADCSIGVYENVVKLACDGGAIEYRFEAGGRIVRTSHPGYSKLIEFIDIDIAPAIDRRNEAAGGWTSVETSVE